jgi:hypothetical protein
VGTPNRSQAGRLIYRIEGSFAFQDICELASAAVQRLIANDHLSDKATIHPCANFLMANSPISDPYRD